MTVIDTLFSILDAGGKVVSGPEHPRLLSPKTMRPLVEANREGLRQLVDTFGHCPVDVFRRAQAFRRQIDEWAPSHRLSVPALVLPDSPAAELGHCVSCGTSMTVGWRCRVCVEAVHVALALSGTEA